jgi:hypothetical protein
MTAARNALVWDGRPGHYEVHYLTLTDPVTGVGFWIRYTMLAPLTGAGEAALWFLAMDPRPARPRVVAEKARFALSELRVSDDPFELSVGPGTLRSDGCAGILAAGEWDLRWAPSPLSLGHVDPLLERLGVAQTMLTLPQADVRIDGTIAVRGETIELRGVHGAQAHLWGSKHARRWAWMHAGFDDGDLLDAVSVVVRRLGRDVGPNTPVVGRLEGEVFASTAPLRVIRNPSRFDVDGWRFEAVDGNRRIVCDVGAPRDSLAGVTYRDPDGEPAYCYNSEIGSARVQLLHRSGRRWVPRRTLLAEGRAHFEYAQREPLAGLELVI